MSLLQKRQRCQACSSKLASMPISGPLQSQDSIERLLACSHRGLEAAGYLYLSDSTSAHVIFSACVAARNRGSPPACLQMSRPA
eukprot:scaffold655929_cov69-Prasinocladus_malaysianus.AAC.1